MWLVRFQKKSRFAFDSTSVTRSSFYVDTVRDIETPVIAVYSVFIEKGEEGGLKVFFSEALEAGKREEATGTMLRSTVRSTGRCCPLVANSDDYRTSLLPSSSELQDKAAF